MQFRLGEIVKQARNVKFDYSKAEKKIYEVSEKIQQNVKFDYSKAERKVYEVSAKIQQTSVSF